MNHFEETAIHEAGHVVANVLVAKDMGYSTSEIVDWVEVTPEGKILNSGILSAGNTRSMFIPREVDNFMEQHGIKEGDEFIPTEMRPKLIAAGIDTRKWFRARAIVSLMGGAAQARYNKRPITDMLQSTLIAMASSSDLETIRDLGPLTLNNASEFFQLFVKALIEVDRLVRRDDVWAAINAVAAALKPGRNSGPEMAEIAVKHLKVSL